MTGSPNVRGARTKRTAAAVGRGTLIVALLLGAVLGAVAGDPAHTLTVSAAVSLSEAFREIGRVFEASHPGVEIRFNFGGSGQLLQQVVAGAPADVLATADEETMNRADAAGVLVPGTRTTVAANALVLVVPADAALDGSGLDAVSRATRIAIGSPDSVPAGRYAREALVLAGLSDALQPRLVFGQNVRQVLDYVARGEADAGFVYRTDVAAAGPRVRALSEVPTATPILYAAAAVRGGREDLARAFVAFAASPAGRAILARHGFGRP